MISIKKSENDGIIELALSEIKLRITLIKLGQI